MVIALFPSPNVLEEIKNHPERFPELSAVQRQRLSAAAPRIVSLLEPLTRIMSRSALDQQLTDVVFPWVRLVTDLIQVLELNQSGRTLLSGLHDVGMDVRELAVKKADLMGEESLEQFLGAYESFLGATEWFIRELTNGETAARKATLMAGITGEALIRAQILVTAIVLVLKDVGEAWKPEALPLLCSALDDYMTQIEDTFDGMSTPSLEEGEFVESRTA